MEMDEDDLLAELEGMEQEDMDRQLLDIPDSAVPDLPSVPNAVPTSAAQEEEDEDMDRQLLDIPDSAVPDLPS